MWRCVVPSSDALAISRLSLNRSVLIPPSYTLKNRGLCRTRRDTGQQKTPGLAMKHRGFRTLPKFSERCSGGDGEIRTHDTGLSPYASLAGKCLRPLGHISILTQHLQHQKTGILPATSGFGQWNAPTFFEKLKLFPDRRPCAGHAPPTPCISRRSARKS